MEDVESRFLHLLQPIRDLTKNWEVDVATQLGEYLQELDQICISFDNGKTSMNFTEAALVIQGSACVYSRKVEYLYSLVYQVLDFISDKKREKQPSSVRPDGTDADASFGPEQQAFLSLDDIGDGSSANVDMRKDHVPSAVNIVPLTPMSLVPLEEAEKRENPLLSHKGELLASRKDFRMNTSTPHASGAFMLELAGLSPICLQHGGDPGGAAGMPPGVLGNTGDCPSISGAAVQALSFLGDGGTAGPDDDGSIGDEAPGDPKDTGERTPECVEPQRRVAQPRGRILQEPAPVQDPRARSKEALDLWQNLDPFSDSEDKPFKKGRPFLVPHGLDDTVGGKRKRKGPRKLQDFMKWFSAVYVTDGQKTRRKGPAFGDLEALYWKQLKQRLATQRELQIRPGLPWPPGEEELDLPEVEECRADCEEGPDEFMEHDELLPKGPEELAQEDSGPPWDMDSLGYEELVRRNVELFIASSQRYVRETALSQHLQHWEERIKPFLQEQEQRSPFDIHRYGQALAEACGVLGRWHYFASLVAGQPPFEVCRHLLATLQLANDSVVELVQAPGLDAVLDTARLRLLTHQLAHERFQTYQPPSAQP